MFPCNDFKKYSNVEKSICRFLNKSTGLVCSPLELLLLYGDTFSPHFGEKQFSTNIPQFIRTQSQRSMGLAECYVHAANPVSSTW